MKTKTLAFPLKIKSVDETGTFAGYGSVFGNVDSYGDVVAPGAFARTLREHATRGSMPALLWQHRAGEPCGVFIAMKEDEHGLYVEGKLALGTQRGREAHELMKLGAITGLSIGYSVVISEFNKETDIYTLKDLELWEVSLVTFPANTSARIDVVKTQTSCETIRDFEAVLRDELGFSAKEAKILASHGWPGLKRRDDAADAAEINDALKGVLTQLKA